MCPGELCDWLWTTATFCKPAAPARDVTSHLPADDREAAEGSRTGILPGEKAGFRGETDDFVKSSRVTWLDIYRRNDHD